MKELDHKNESIPEYIKEQANHSWQMELFISLGMIFTLTKIPSIISKEFLASEINVDIDSLTILIFFGLVVLSRVLLIGFSANLILRAIWLGILGIYYVYPQGINYEKLNFSEYFKKKFKPKYTTLQKVQKLERYSSLAFSIGILSGLQCLGILLSMGIILFVTLRIFYVQALNTHFGAYILLFIFVLFTIGTFDKLIFGRLKKFKWLNKLYWPIHKIINFMTLNGLIQNEKLTVASNSGRWKTALMSFLYIFIAFVISANDMRMADTLGLRNYSRLDSRKFMNVPGQHLYLQNDEYDDLLKETDIVEKASIPSEIIKGDHLSIFVTYDKIYDVNFENRAKLSELKMEFKDIRTNEKYKLNGDKMRTIIDNSIYVLLNGIEYDSLRWYFRDHTITHQRGFQTLIDISGLENGNHELVVRPLLMNRLNEIDTSRGRWIPFIKTDK